MRLLFDEPGWTAVTVRNVAETMTVKAGTHIVSTGNTASFELAVKCHGATDIRYAGKRLDFHAGSVLYLPKEPHGNVPYVKTILEPGDGVCVFFDSALPMPKAAFVLEFTDPAVERLFRRLCRCANDPHALPIRVLSLFYDLIALLAESTRQRRLGSPASSRLAPAVDYFDAHASDASADMEKAASLCGMKVNYFSHRFRKLYGMPPKAYAARVKVSAARRILLASSAPVGEVAVSLGFRDANYFSRFFKKQCGMTPTDFRKRYGEAT